VGKPGRGGVLGILADTPSSPLLDPDERARLQLQTLRVLTLGQVVGAAALSSAITVGAFVVEDILGQNTSWAGLSTAGVTTGTAVMSQVLARHMRRYGRRVGMQFGYGLAALGGLTASFGAEHRWLVVFLVGLFFYGSGTATNRLARYAATDLAQPGHRSQAMSRVLFASAFRAVFGPMLIGPAERAGQAWFGLTRYAGPFLFSPWSAGSATATVGCKPSSWAAACCWEPPSWPR
jgi:MFS family permease